MLLFQSAIEKLKPPVTMAFLGDTKYFTCLSNGHKKWSFNNGELPLNVDILGRPKKYITIKTVVANNEGTYRCVTIKNTGHIHVAEGRLIVSGKFRQLTITFTE